MAAKTLNQLILDSGIQAPYFFNGRLLSAEDLRKEQDAARRRIQAIGNAAGEGIAYGFEISLPPGGSAAVVKVAAGLAVNRLGRTLLLKTGFDLSLSEPTPPDGNGGPGFSDCVPPQTGVYVSGVGVYLLVVCPVEDKQDRAPVSGLGNETTSCNSRYVVEGVQFRLVQVTSLPAADLASAPRRRNRIAHRCFGTDEIGVNPFSAAAPNNWGLVEEMRKTGQITDCDVPLAIFSWTASQQLTDLDNWSVRRRVASLLVPPGSAASPGNLAWSKISSSRRRAEAEAMFLQFQEHLASLAPAGLAASTNFRYLPPAGCLRVGTGGLNWKTFLGHLSRGSATPMDPGLLREIVVRSFDQDPIDLDDSPPVPVDVFRPSSGENWVVFARTRRARFRLAFTGGSPAGEDELTASAVESNFSARFSSPASGFPYTADVPPGEYTIHLRSAQFQDRDAGPITAPGGRVTGATLALTPRPGAVTRGSIRVVTPPNVLFLLNLSPSAVSVRAISATGAQTSATRVGDDFVMANLLPGAYTVRASTNLAIMGQTLFERTGVVVEAGRETRIEP